MSRAASPWSGPEADLAPLLPPAPPAPAEPSGTSPTDPARTSLLRTIAFRVLAGSRGWTLAWTHEGLALTPPSGDAQVLLTPGFVVKLRRAGTAEVSDASRDAARRARAETARFAFVNPELALPQAPAPVRQVSPQPAAPAAPAPSALPRPVSFRHNGPKGRLAGLLEAVIKTSTPARVVGSWNGLEWSINWYGEDARVSSLADGCGFTVSAHGEVSAPREYKGDFDHKPKAPCAEIGAVADAVRAELAKAVAA